MIEKIRNEIFNAVSDGVSIESIEVNVRTAFNLIRNNSCEAELSDKIFYTICGVRISIKKRIDDGKAIAVTSDNRRIEIEL